jgi:hypothetical protein
MGNVRTLDEPTVAEGLAGLSRDRRRAPPSGYAPAIASATRKTFDHPEVGPITLDCDVLVVQESDLRVIVYTAPAGSPDAEALALLGTIGLQSFSAPA